MKIEYSVGGLVDLVALPELQPETHYDLIYDRRQCLYIVSDLAFHFSPNLTRIASAKGPDMLRFIIVNKKYIKSFYHETPEA